MKLDWDKIWQEFDEVFDVFLLNGGVNTWTNQKKFIEQIIEKQSEFKNIDEVNRLLEQTDHKE